ncbi:ATPase involved in DNA repair [Halorubrum sp. DM2]|uniref:AAA family ATPase n=1 Tax=Halorubrum sp. DM2 TaxID=2527867 RepID=UPI0024B82AA1|nr:AAA family ATPase [Halorubrum sp. DM2]VTT86711.1 ATPase involved in DNA repair [Halorubrum sp. DM2]
MKLLSIEVVNFRPYRESQIDLTDRDGSIHIIEGDQGGGKTSLHTAIQWGLYGGAGPKSNYTKHWNERAKQAGEEEMSVKIKFKEGSRNYTLIREIGRFNQNQQRAHEDLTLIGDTETYSGEDAQDQIEEILPEELKRFFFLDGERIQELIAEDAGQKVKREIETVLKHRTIINSQKDLGDLLEDRLIPRRNRIEEEAKERDEILDEISNLREDIRQLRQRNKEDRDEIQNNKTALKKNRKELESVNKEAIDRINELESDTTSLQTDKVKELSKLNISWKKLRYQILSEDLKQIKQEIIEEIEEYEGRLSDIERDEIINDLAEEAKQGKCPICGTEEIESLEEHSVRDHDKKQSEKLTEKLVELREMRDRLDSVNFPQNYPVDHQTEIDRINEEIKDNQTERKDLLGDLGGVPDDSEQDTLENNINDLEDSIDSLQEEIDNREETIREKEQEIKKLESKREENASNQELDKVNSKIDAGETAIEKLKTIRNIHVRDKREKIKSEMNQVFEQVAQSDFMDQRYQGLDFRGDPSDEDSYVLQLIESDGETKDMANHEPSAGESQLTALSFIFGLNKYARYSSTIVFDTVAGRLDLTNSQAQGEFFSNLEDPLLLLVTDSELRDLGDAVNEEIGAHYRIKPDGKDSKLERVK